MFTTVAPVAYTMMLGSTIFTFVRTAFQKITEASAKYDEVLLTSSMASFLIAWPIGSHSSLALSSFAVAERRMAGINGVRLMPIETVERPLLIKLLDISPL